MDTALLLVAGLLLLLGGAELMVRGAARLALATGLSPLVVGLTVVAYATSAPELAVSVDAALAGTPAVAVGNVVGSNIANVLLILGLAALVAPLRVGRQLIRLDVPLLVAVSAGVLLLALDGRIGRGEGGALVLLAVAYTAFVVRWARREPAASQAAVGEVPELTVPAVWWRDAALVVGGLVLLVGGAHGLVSAAVSLARGLGLSELVIGLTIVAVGTSLPEIAASVLAAVRGHTEMAVGNVIGSNLFNLLVVLGASAALAADGMPVGAAARSFDLPVMTAVAFACLPIFFTGHCIARWEGGLFLGYYGAYVAYLLLDGTGHDAAPLLGWVIMAFVLPLTVLTLAVVTVRAWRARHAR